MISSIVEDPPSRCPLCGSEAVRSYVKAYPGVGVLSKTSCDSCAFWACNCAFKAGDGVEYRGFVKEGELPPDLPMAMKEDVVLWRMSPRGCGGRSRRAPTSRNTREGRIPHASRASSWPDG